MGALALTTTSRTGAVVAGAAVASTDTISRTVLGTRGCLLIVINGNASGDTVTVSDAETTTQGGAAAAAISTSVGAGTSRVFKVLPRQADPTTGLVTVTHSVTTTVTYQLLPLG